MSLPVVVVGGGPAGSATAILLAHRGVRVILFDRARFPRRKACAEYVSPGGVELLTALGLEETPGRELRGMAIHAPGGACHLVQYRGGQRTGRSIDRLDLDSALVDLARNSGVDVREGCRVASVTTSATRVTGVRLVSGDDVRAEVVVGADGLHSVVARIHGRPLPTVWPRKLGLVAHYRGVPWPEPHGQMWVSQHGYVGAAPLDEFGRVTVGLVGPLNDTQFESALDAHYPELAARLRRGRREDQVIGVGPLARRVRRPNGPGYVLVGDAAGFFDPFTGEGIYRALRGAHLVEQALCDNLDYRQLRRRAFAAKERLTLIIQLFVQTPRLLDLALRRLRERPAVATRLGNMLGDLEPARLDVVLHLLRP